MIINIDTTLRIIGFLCLLLKLQCCSDFMLNSTAGAVVSGRTMDFKIDLKTVIEVIPRGTRFNEPTVYNCPKCPDFEWKAKYGFVAFQVVGVNTAADGMNEKGLSAAWLYLVGTEYPKPVISDPRPIISGSCSYILGNFATVDEVKEGIKDIQFAEIDGPGLAELVHTQPIRIPLHISVHDADGNNLVIEFVNGKVVVHDNPNGVVTNEPTLDWHLTNVAINKDSDIPGGYSSSARFLRISKLNAFIPSIYPPNATYNSLDPEQGAISDTLHILNTVVRPKGANGDTAREFHHIGGATQWSAVRDHKNLKLYFSSTQNQVLRMIDFNQLDFTRQSSRKDLAVQFGWWAVDVSDTLNWPELQNKTIDLPPRSVISHSLSGRKVFTANTQQLERRTHNGDLLIGVVLGIGGSCLIAFLKSSLERKGYSEI